MGWREKIVEDDDLGNVLSVNLKRGLPVGLSTGPWLRGLGSSKSMFLNK